MVPTVQEAIQRAGPRFIGVLEFLKNGHQGISDLYFDRVRNEILALGLKQISAESFDRELTDDLKSLLLPVWYGYHGQDRGSWHPDDWAVARPVFVEAIRGIVDLSIVRIMCVAPGRIGHDYVMPLDQRSTRLGFEGFIGLPHRSKWEARIAALAKALHASNLMQIPDDFTGRDGKYYRQKATGCMKVMQTELRYANWPGWLAGTVTVAYPGP